MKRIFLSLSGVFYFILTSNAQTSFWSELGPNATPVHNASDLSNNCPRVADEGVGKFSVIAVNPQQ